ERPPLRPDSPPRMGRIVLDHVAIVGEGFQEIRQFPQADRIHKLRIGYRAAGVATSPDRGEPPMDLEGGQSEWLANLMQGADVGVQRLPRFDETIEVAPVVLIRLRGQAETAP